MRPFRETLPWTDGSSIALLDRRLDEAIPFQWHHHPAWELTLTSNSVGQRFIGDHVEAYGDGDLVLVAPNLPHTWVSRDRIAPGPHHAHVIWFTQAWLDRIGGLAEFSALDHLAVSAQRGLAISAKSAAKVAPVIRMIFEQSEQDRLMSLIGVLALLAEDPATPLSSLPARGATQGQVGRSTPGRMDRLLSHVHAQYTRRLPISELAEVAALSPSGLHRMFRQQTGRTVSAYLIGLRIGAAAARLMGGDEPIGQIASDVGYATLANFNRQFRAAKGMTPREYRRRFR